MKTGHAIFGAVVAAFGGAAFVTFYDEFKPGTRTSPHSNAAVQKADLTPANSIAHDFAVLDTTLASSIAQELAAVPKSVRTVPSGTQTPRDLNAAVQTADSLTPANSIAHDFAALHATRTSSSAKELVGVPKSIQTVPSGAQTPPHPNAAQMTDSLTPANSIAHDFAVLHATPTSSSAQELVGVPKSVHTVTVGRGSSLLPALPTPTQAVAPTPAPPAARAADHQAVPETLPSRAEPVDVCAHNGGHRVDFMRGDHSMWRCIYPRHR